MDCLSSAVGRTLGDGICGSAVFCNFKDLDAIHSSVPGKGSHIVWKIVNKKKNTFPFDSISWHWLYGELGKAERVAARREGSWKRKRETALTWGSLSWQTDGNLYPVQVDLSLRLEMEGPSIHSEEVGSMTSIPSLP